MAGVQEVLAERYELLDVLGRGGMGVVFRAHDRVLERVVAIKVLPLDRAQDPISVARFEREALAVAALSHRNIVAVFDSGADEETRFIVMEYLRGQSLAALVRDRGALSIEQAVSVSAQIAAALAAAHAAGIVHRDIKPANVMVDEHGHVKVLDFGIARLTAGISLTQTAMVLGSAPYLAPELSRGARADARSDIYALGCVFYELLTGRPPFTGELPAAIIHQQISATPRSPERLNSAIPPALSALALQMLAKEPDRRPQDAGYLVTALPEALADAAPTIRLADAAPTVPVAPAGVTAALAPTRVMSIRSGRPRWATRTYAALASLLSVAVVIALFALTAGSDTVARHHKRSATATTHASTTTQAGATPGSTTNTAPLQHTPPAAGPPAHQPGGPHDGGPHDGGPPPGKAKKPKKHGDGHKQGDGQKQNEQ